MSRPAGSDRLLAVILYGVEGLPGRGGLFTVAVDGSEEPERFGAKKNSYLFWPKWRR